ncbi:MULTISPECIES: site-specific integrase [Amycolatopsis]|uniref:Tyrosine recombinase XerC n=1 Tax=Amycolatopsis albidoflavus TaxID=102226 RepID=A0ABW5I796_9PSEU
MARLPTEIGTYGKIHIKEIEPGVFEARARFRKRNGKIARPRRRGKSATAAERALKKAMTDLVDDVASKALNRKSKFGRAIDLFIAGFKEKVELGLRQEKSLYDYEDSAEQIRKYMGELTCGEAENAGLCDETLKSIRKDAAKSKRSKRSKGYSAAKRARTVMSGVCELAVRYGAMSSNPARSVEVIENPDQEDVRALEPEDRQDFRMKFRAECERRAAEFNGSPRGRVWTDMPDAVDVIFATGARPGEVLALDGPGVNPKKQTVLIDHHLVRVEGQGIVRKPRRKGPRGHGGTPVNPMYPNWSAPTFLRVKVAAGPGPLFPTWNGQWMDPGNFQKRFRSVCDAIGYSWVYARIARHTVGTHIVDQGGTNEDAADQLGNSPDVVQSNYRRQRKTNPANAARLESLFDAPDTGS